MAYPFSTITPIAQAPIAISLYNAAYSIPFTSPPSQINVLSGNTFTPILSAETAGVAGYGAGSPYGQSLGNWAGASYFVPLPTTVYGQDQNHTLCFSPTPPPKWGIDCPILELGLLSIYTAVSTSNNVYKQIHSAVALEPVYGNNVGIVSWQDAYTPQSIIPMIATLVMGFNGNVFLVGCNYQPSGGITAVENYLQGCNIYTPSNGINFNFMPIGSFVVGNTVLPLTCWYSDNANYVLSFYHNGSDADAYILTKITASDASHCTSNMILPLHLTGSLANSRISICPLGFLISPNPLTSTACYILSFDGSKYYPLTITDHTTDHLASVLTTQFAIDNNGIFYVIGEKYHDIIHATYSSPVGNSFVPAPIIPPKPPTIINPLLSIPSLPCYNTCQPIPGINQGS